MARTVHVGVVVELLFPTWKEESYWKYDRQGGLYKDVKAYRRGESPEEFPDVERGRSHVGAPSEEFSLSLCMLLLHHATHPHDLHTNLLKACMPPYRSLQPDLNTLHHIQLLELPISSSPCTRRLSMLFFITMRVSMLDPCCPHRLAAVPFKLLMHTIALQIAAPCTPASRSLSIAMHISCRKRKPSCDCPSIPRPCNIRCHLPRSCMQVPSDLASIPPLDLPRHTTLLMSPIASMQDPAAPAQSAVPPSRTLLLATAHAAMRYMPPHAAAPSGSITTALLKPIPTTQNHAAHFLSELCPATQLARFHRSAPMITCYPHAKPAPMLLITMQIAFTKLLADVRPLLYR